MSHIHSTGCHPDDISRQKKHGEKAARANILVVARIGRLTGHEIIGIAVDHPYIHEVQGYEKIGPKKRGRALGACFSGTFLA